MADKKISQLTALSAANVAPATDVLAIVDTSATETKKITAKDLIDGALNGGTANGVLYLNGSKVATSGSALVFDGTNVDFGTVGAKLNFPTTSSSTKNYVGGAADGFSLEMVTQRGAIQPISYKQDYSVGHVWSLTGTGAMALTSTGLGIGTASPAAKLDVSGQVLSRGSVGAFVMESRDGSGASWSLYNPTGDDLRIFGNSDDRLIITNAGNLFCGGTTGSSRLNLQTATNSSTDSNYITLYNAGENVGHINWINGNGDLARITGTKAGTGASANDGILTFSTATDAVLTERGRFTAGGYFKASNSGTYAGSTGAYHELYKAENNADWTAVVTHAGATAGNQYGIRIDLTGDPNGTGNEFWLCRGNLTTRAAMRSNGGLANYQTNDVNLSDERVKTDIAPLGSMWAKFKALEIVTFKYKDQTHEDNNIGVIAQQVEAVAPEFVDADGWGETPEDGVPLKSIYTADMYHAAIKALQEAMARIESLEADVAALKASA